MIFCVFIYIFCLESMLREQRMRMTCHYHGIFFKSTILKLLDHSYAQSSFVTIRRHFDNSIWSDTLQLKISWTQINIGTNYFLSKFLQMKINKSAWKIIYTIIWACSLKDIAPRHFTYFCMLLFLSNKHSF